MWTWVRSVQVKTQSTKTQSTNKTLEPVYKLVTWVSSDQIKSDSVDTVYVAWDMRIHFIFDIDDTVYQQNTLKTELYNSDHVHKLVAHTNK